ncbi:hypothetical protein QUF74_15790 [Candidatus Halobeggiatoa sp. HSG11]|nr:hypothetical protein [Candidatus Halobeggiatoa sp. HSG11]
MIASKNLLGFKKLVGLTLHITGLPDNERSPALDKLLEIIAWQNVKIEELENLILIHDTKIIKPDNIPEGSKFKKYTDIVVQDLIIEVNNICYRLAQYETPNGQYITGQLPEGIRDNHWGKDLQSFILYQYHHQHVTQPIGTVTRFKY